MIASDYVTLSAFVNRLRDALASVQRCAERGACDSAERRLLEASLREVQHELAIVAQTIQDRQLRSWRPDHVVREPAGPSVDVARREGALTPPVERFTLSGNRHAERHAPMPVLSGRWKLGRPVAPVPSDESSS